MQIYFCVFLLYYIYVLARNLVIPNTTDISLYIKVGTHLAVLHSLMQSIGRSVYDRSSIGIYLRNATVRVPGATCTYDFKL